MTKGFFAWLILSIACLPPSVFTGGFIREKALCHDNPHNTPTKFVDAVIIAASNLISDALPFTSCRDLRLR
jgi:hypothetical protein